jgi:predicted ATP-dependent endonuclease of OLD family
MRIESVRIQNLRSIKDQTIEFGDYTCLVGPNGSGKSTILCALNILFRQTQDCPTSLTELEEEDFHQRNTADPITITATFTDLSEDAKRDLVHYVRQDKLVLSAQAPFDPNTRKATVLQHGQRFVMREFAPFFKAKDDRARAEDLRSIYKDIRQEFPDLEPPGSVPTMTQSLSTYESQHPEASQLTWSEDQFYGVSRGKNVLEKHVQWLYVPAVKDASSEQVEGKSTWLDDLLARTVRSRIDFADRLNEFRQHWREQYQGMLDENQLALDDISHVLTAGVAHWSHEGASARLEWAQDPDKSVSVSDPFAQLVAGEGAFEGKLPRFGHGLQRPYLLALLELLATSDETRAPSLVLACEDPEIYQHPPQAAHLSSVLQRLTQRNSQVIVCTHSPYFVSGKGFEDVRMTRKEDGQCVVSRATYEDVSKTIAQATGKQPTEPEALLAKIHQALQPSLNELFFTPRPILVEGLEDIAYVTTYLHLTGLWDEYRRYGCHMIRTDGKSRMIRPLAVANCLRLPAYAIFDADSDEPDKNGRKAQHAKDNEAILSLCGVATPEPFPKTDFWDKRVTMWRNEIGDVVKDEIGGADWQSYRAQADKEYAHGGDLHKNVLHIATSLTLAWNNGRKSDSLMKLCRKLVEFGKAASGR